MSKGTPRTTIRIPPELEAQLMAEIERSETTRFDGPWNLTSIILAGVKEKLRHLRAGRKEGGRKKREKTKGSHFYCEQCTEGLSNTDSGSVTLCPDGTFVAVCWLCLLQVGPFRPVS